MAILVRIQVEERLFDTPLDLVRDNRRTTKGWD